MHTVDINIKTEVAATQTNNSRSRQSTQAESVSTHGMPGVLNESSTKGKYEGERERELRVSEELESHTLTSKFNMEAIKPRNC